MYSSFHCNAFRSKIPMVFSQGSELFQAAVELSASRPPKDIICRLPAKPHAWKWRFGVSSSLTRNHLKSGKDRIQMSDEIVSPDSLPPYINLEEKDLSQPAFSYLRVRLGQIHKLTSRMCPACSVHRPHRSRLSEKEQTSWFDFATCCRRGQRRPIYRMIAWFGSLE